MKARGSSIDRNKVKRQIREVFRTHAELLGSYDYNVVVPATKKLTHPYSLKLGDCLRKRLPNELG
jgi:ribonuclease P protein component